MLKEENPEDSFAYRVQWLKNSIEIMGYKKCYLDLIITKRNEIPIRIFKLIKQIQNLSLGICYYGQTSSGKT